MLTDARIENALTILAERFDLAAHQQPGGVRESGWGQFLDVGRADRQTGPYGTSAGLIARAASGRLATAGREVEPVTLLRTRWDNQQNDPTAQALFSQNLRCAFLYLALRLGDADTTFRDAVESELLRRRLPGGTWGHWWLTATDYDQTPRPFVTAAVGLSATLSIRDNMHVNNAFTDIGVSLSGALADQGSMPPGHESMLMAALLASGGTIPSSARRALTRYAYRQEIDVAHTTVYFFDYNNPAELRDDKAVGRDYFIVPTEALRTIAGFQQGAPAVLRLRAENSLAKIHAVLEREGWFRTTNTDRVSTKNQAWIALALASARNAGKGTRPLGWLTYQLRRRRHNRFIDGMLPPIAIVTVAGLGAVIGASEPSIELAGVTASCIAIVGMICGWMTAGSKIVV